MAEMMRPVMAGSNADISAIFVIATLAVAAMWVWFSVRRTMSRMAPAIVRRLQRYGRHSIQLGFFGRAWNPASPLRSGNDVAGPGLAAYELDPYGTVHLTFTPKSGHAQHFKGPVPASLVNPVKRRHPKLVRRLMAGYIGTVAIAFIVTVVLWHGSWGARVVAGLLAAGGTMVLWTLVTQAFLVGRAVKGVSKPGKPPTG